MSIPWVPRITVAAGLFAKRPVLDIARDIGVPVSQVVGCLVQFWLEAQARADEAGVLKGKSNTWLDCLVGVPRFADAMVAAGWLVVTPAGLQVVNFHEWISKKAQKRVENAARMAERRAAGRADGDDHECDNRTQPHTTAHKVPAVAKKPKATGAKKPVKADVTDTRFWLFWRAYPAHRAYDQPKTYAAWVELQLTDEVVATVLAGLEAWKASAEWRKDNGRFVPASFTWLAGRRWETRPAAGGGGAGGGARLQPRAGGYKTGRSFSSDEPPPADPGPDPGGRSPGLFG